MQVAKSPFKVQVRLLYQLPSLSPKHGPCRSVKDLLKYGQVKSSTEAAGSPEHGLTLFTLIQTSRKKVKGPHECNSAECNGSMEKYFCSERSFLQQVCVRLQNLIGSCKNKGKKSHIFCSVVGTYKKYISNLWKISNFTVFYFLR